MAEGDEDRTEAATPRRRTRAREAGQAPMSREAAPLATLVTATLLLMLAAPPVARAVTARLAVLLGQADALSPAAALRLAGEAAVLGALPFALAGALASAAAVLAQTGLLIHLPSLLPDLGRLAPQRGLQRIFSLSALADTGRTLLKLAAAGAAAWTVLRAALPGLPASFGWTPDLLLDQITRTVLRVLLTLVGMQAAITGLDIFRARRTHEASLRMSRQDIREEHKESEGNPQIRARIRRLQMQRARRRMMAAVPNAAVVVTNPTHYAVALAYQRGSAAAPRVVAKGTDETAARIRDLARALHAVELEAEIPRELYQAVAELIAYVWRLRTRAL
ncbi:MAG TPA: EscU/YscU/HrcU family type III secretion system export apparatus switch protein [Acetobacteraceae bacterium]|nr:EscU/YscU/HrcU family type III secretion system export apparatus switch protein [Acetobacteraceae bacterium]